MYCLKKLTVLLLFIKKFLISELLVIVVQGSPTFLSRGLIENFRGPSK